MVHSSLGGCGRVMSTSFTGGRSRSQAWKVKVVPPHRLPALPRRTEGSGTEGRRWTRQGGGSCAHRRWGTSAGARRPCTQTARKHPAVRTRCRARAESCSLCVKCPAARPGCRKRKRSPKSRGTDFRLRGARRAGKRGRRLEGTLAPPRRPHFRFSGGVFRGVGPSAGRQLRHLSASMEAPVEAEGENEDGDSSSGDLCCMDKGLRR